MSATSGNVNTGVIIRSQTFESTHPYDDNSNIFTEISFPGAVLMIFTFDEKSATENEYDYVKIWKTAQMEEVWHPDVVSYNGRGGAENWPGCGGRAPLGVAGDMAFIEFCSDGSNNDWGWKVEVKAEFPGIKAVLQVHWLLQADWELLLLPHCFLNVVIMLFSGT